MPVPVREMVVDWDYQRDNVRAFKLRLRTEPVVRIDNREVVGARFVGPQTLLAEHNVPPSIRAYLGGGRTGRQRPPAGA